MVEGNLEDFHKSINSEMQAIKNRVRNLIGNAHWGEEGRFKEAILINMISKFLPSDLSIGTGFVIKKDEDDKLLTTSQIDLIIYKNTYPTFFKEGNFLILNPEPVVGIIEVKTRIRRSSENSLKKILDKSFKNASLIITGKKYGHNETSFFNGIFSYKSDISWDIGLNEYKNHLTEIDENEDVTINILGSNPLVNHICIDENIFLKTQTNELLAFEFDKLAPSYFISNLLDNLKHFELGDQSLWFASPKKSNFYKGFIELFQISKNNQNNR
jgi:hypothetical protein